MAAITPRGVTDRLVVALLALKDSCMHTTIRRIPVHEPDENAENT